MNLLGDPEPRVHRQLVAVPCFASAEHIVEAWAREQSPPLTNRGQGFHQFRQSIVLNNFDGRGDEARSRRAYQIIRRLELARTAAWYQCEAPDLAVSQNLYADPEKFRDAIPS